MESSKKQKTLRFAKPSGFTLIELLIVTGIIAILVAFGTANFRNFSQGRTLESAKSQVLGDLRQGQQLALSGSKPSSGCTSFEGVKFRRENSTTYSLVALCNPEGEKSIQKDNRNLPATITISGGNPIFGAVGKSGTGANITLTQLGTGDTEVINISDKGKIE